MYKYVKEEIAEKLINNEFFINCGRKNNLKYEFDFDFQANREKAIKSMTNDKWSDFLFEILQDVASNHGGIYAKYSDTSKEAIKEVVPKIVEAIRKNNHDKEMLNLILVDLKYHLGACLTLENYKSEKTQIFEQILAVYLSGHIPCGVKGSRKKWKIIVH